MSPFADAMSLVYCYTSELAMAVDGFQYPAEVVHCTEFWRHVKEPRSRMSALEIIHNNLSNSWRRGTVDRFDANVCRSQCSDLVVHKCKQRRNYYGDCKGQYGKLFLKEHVFLLP